MRIIKHLSPCQILIEKVFKPEDLTKIEEQVLKTKCAEITVPGFRPGNTPLEKIREIIEPTPEWEKLVGIKLQEELIDNWAQDHVAELGEIVKIIDLKVTQKEPLTVQSQFEYFPRVSENLLGEKYKQIKISNKIAPGEIKVTDNEVENTLLEIQKRRTALEPAPQDSLQKERLAFIVLRSQNEKDEVKKDSLRGRDLFQWGISQYGPEFDAKTQDMKEGEEKIIILENLKDPAIAKLEKIVKLDKKKPELRLNLKVEKIFTAKIPPIDDEFAKSLGHFHNIAELKASIKLGATLEKLYHEKNNRKDAFINALLQMVDLGLPESIVRRSASSLKKDFEKRMNQELTRESQKIEKDEAKINRAFEERARNELKLERILEAVAQKEKIVPSVDEVEEEIQKTLCSFSSPKEARKSLGNPESLRSRITLALCFDKTLKFLEQENHISDDLDPEITRIEKELHKSHEHHHEH